MEHAGMGFHMGMSTNMCGCEYGCGCGWRPCGGQMLPRVTLNCPRHKHFETSVIFSSYAMRKQTVTGQWRQCLILASI